MSEPTDLESAVPSRAPVQPWLSVESAKSGVLGAASIVGLFTVQDLVGGRGPWFARFVVTEPLGWAAFVSIAAVWVALDRWQVRNVAKWEEGSAEERAHLWNAAIDRFEQPGWWWRLLPITLFPTAMGAALGALIGWMGGGGTLREILTWSSGCASFSFVVSGAFLALTRKAAIRRFKEQ